MIFGLCTSFRNVERFAPRDLGCDPSKTPRDSCVGQAGAVADGSTYSVLHAGWLERGDVVAAVTALAQAKSAAEGSADRRTTEPEPEPEPEPEAQAGAGAGAKAGAGAGSDDQVSAGAGAGAGAGADIWDEAQRSAEICRHIQPAGHEEEQERRAAHFEWLWAYFAELQRQGLASAAVYGASHSHSRYPVHAWTFAILA